MDKTAFFISIAFKRLITGYSKQ